MIIAVTIQKGGTGKTTSAAILSQAAIYRGQTCLAIDLDPQHNLSIALGVDHSKGLTAADLFKGSRIRDVIRTSDQGMDIIAGGPDLGAVTTGTGSARRLKKALEPVRKKYDIIIIDTPATIGELHYNALVAAEGLVIPINTDLYNIHSLYQTMETARQIRQANKKLEIMGVIITMYSGRAAVYRQTADVIQGAAITAGLPVLGTVRRSAAVNEAVIKGLSLYDYSRRSQPAQEYLHIYDNLMGR